MALDHKSLQAHTLRTYPSGARALSGQALDDSKAILNSLGHFLYRDIPSVGPIRKYVTATGRPFTCEGRGAATVCKWA